MLEGLLNTLILTVRYVYLTCLGFRGANFWFPMPTDVFSNVCCFP